METDFHIIESLLVLLVVAVVVSAVCHKIKVNALLGYLAAGAIIGPFGLNILDDGANTATLGEMGVVFLMFTIGLEVPMEKLRQLRRYVLGLGSLQVLLCGSAIGAVIIAFNGSIESRLKKVRTEYDS